MEAFHYPTTINPFALDSSECLLLLEIVRELDIKSCLEFGAGVSTQIFVQILGISNIWSFETHGPTLALLSGYQLHQRDMNHAYTSSMHYEDRLVFGRSHFDMAFVDGPPVYSKEMLYEGKYARWNSVICAKLFSDVILMHDTLRFGEQCTIQALLGNWIRREFKSMRGLTLFKRPIDTSDLAAS